MSQLHRIPVTTSPVSDKVSDKVSDYEPQLSDYKPQHPTLGAIAGLKQARDNTVDHLENYVEVNPFVEEERNK
jgi:hypothetical protein